MRRIRVRTSGGIANVEIDDALDLDDLDPDVAGGVERIFSATPSPTPATSNAVDAIEYDLWLLDDEDEGKESHITLTDADASAETLGVLDEVVGEIVRRKVAERRRARDTTTGG